MNVAVPCVQHSPMFGQRASSHTVCRLSSRINPFNRRYDGEPGARTFSHSGFGSRGATGVNGITVDTAVLILIQD